MSSILRTCLRSPVLRAPRPAATTRSFQTSRVVFAGKESALHNENRAEVAEHHKQDQLQKQKEGKGQWKDELASDSESIIKAEKGSVGNTKDHIQELQRESAQTAQDEKKSG